MSKLKKIFFQASIPLALVSMFFCSPVFSLNSYTDTDKFSVSLSSPYAGYPVNNCFDRDLDNFCVANSSGYLEIDFIGAFNVSSFTFYNRKSCCQDRVSHILINDTDSISLTSELVQNFSNFENIDNIKIFPKSNEFLNLAEVLFDFEVLATGGNGDGDGNNDISKGVNWSMFSYSFTIVAVLSLFGRGIKSILDLVKYG